MTSASADGTAGRGAGLGAVTTGAACTAGAESCGAAAAGPSAIGAPAPDRGDSTVAVGGATGLLTRSAGNWPEPAATLSAACSPDSLASGSATKRPDGWPSALQRSQARPSASTGSGGRSAQRMCSAAKARKTWSPAAQFIDRRRAPKPGGVGPPRGLVHVTSATHSIVGPSGPAGRSVTVSCACGDSGFLQAKKAPPRLKLVQTTSNGAAPAGRASPVTKHG